MWSAAADRYSSHGTTHSSALLLLLQQVLLPYAR